jgi:hypothetical protein
MYQYFSTWYHRWHICKLIAQEDRVHADYGQAGEVPRIQYFLADERHHVIVGNAV